MLNVVPSLHSLSTTLFFRKVRNIRVIENDNRIFKFIFRLRKYYSFNEAILEKWLLCDCNMRRAYGVYNYRFSSIL